MTIEDAQSVGEFNQELRLRETEVRFPRADWDQLFNGEAPGEEWILEPLISAGRQITIYSPPKTGKSLLMLEIAAALATGGDVLGCKPKRKYRVLYLDYENNVRGDVRTRLLAMGYGTTPGELDHFVHLAFPSLLAPLDTIKGREGMDLLIDRYKPDVVVIDTVSRAVQGKENDNDTWLEFYKHLGLLLKHHGIALVRLDHSGKDVGKGTRGGSAKSGDVDAVWRLSVVVKDRTYQLEMEDGRFEVETKVLILERKIDPLRHEVTGTDVMDAQVKKMVAELDALEVPLNLGRDKVREVYKPKASQTVLTKAISVRKARGQVKP